MKVLINRTDAIGDTLLSLPIAKLIKKNYPQAKVAFVVSPRSYDLIKLCDGLDQVFEFDHKNNKAKETLENIFHEFSPDFYFHLGGSFLPTKMAFKKRIPFRGGLRSRLASFFYLNKGVRQKRSTEGLHESLYNFQLLKPMGITFNENDWNSFGPQFQLNSVLLEECKREVSDKKLIIVHPGMSGHTLNWPSEFYGELLIHLENKVKEYNFKILISYTPSDEPYLSGVKKVLEEAPDNKIEFFNGAEKGLVYFTHLLSLAKLFIGPSTGTTHMANALGIPQVGIYSPIKAQSKERWGPYRQDEKVRLFGPTSCAIDDCMSTIGVNEVYDACLQLLALKEREHS